MNAGLLAVPVNMIYPNGTNLYACAYNGIFISTNNGTNWTTSSDVINQNVRAVAVNGSNIFAGTSKNGIYLSTNNGINWTQINSGLTNLYVFSFGIIGTNIFAGTYGGGVFLSTNNGTNWTAVNSGLTNLNVCSLLISGSKIFITTYGGGVFLSTDNGTSWNAINNGINTGHLYSYCLFKDNQNLYVGTVGGGIYTSTNDGTSWIQITQPSQSQTSPVYSITKSGSNIFAGTAYGVYLSTNNGINWNAVNTGLPLTNQIYVYSLSIVGNYIYMGSNALGIWKRPLSEMITGVEQKNNIPTQFSLEQNYPNPFNPNTTITYSLPKSSFVTLKIFDELGREIKTLVCENKLPGKYEVKFDGRNLSSGVYFYKITAGDFVETKKLILMK